MHLKNNQEFEENVKQVFERMLFNHLKKPNKKNGNGQNRGKTTKGRCYKIIPATAGLSHVLLLLGPWLAQKLLKAAVTNKKGDGHVMTATN